MTTFINPADQPDFTRFGLSLGVATDNLVFAVGQANDTENRRRMEEADTVENETRICLRMIESVLKEAGCTMADVVKTTVYLTDEAYRPAFQAAYREFFDPDRLPCRCGFIVGIGSGCRVEIDAIAVRGSGAQAA